MTEILGYGEDCLTLLALQDQEIINKIINKDESATCLIFYRPSFGRGRNIGEFDAIIATKKTIYLIESKWDSNKRKRIPVNIEIREEQAVRHEFFECCLISDVDTCFKERSKSVPEDSSLLISNLTNLIKKVKEIHELDPPSVKHILLWFYNGRKQGPDIEANVNVSLQNNSNSKIQFKPIPIDYQKYICDGTLFLTMKGKK